MMALQRYKNKHLQTYAWVSVLGRCISEPPSVKNIRHYIITLCISYQHHHPCKYLTLHNYSHIRRSITKKPSGSSQILPKIGKYRAHRVWIEKKQFSVSAISRNGFFSHFSSLALEFWDSMQFEILDSFSNKFAHNLLEEEVKSGRQLIGRICRKNFPKTCNQIGDIIKSALSLSEMQILAVTHFHR